MMKEYWGVGGHFSSFKLLINPVESLSFKQICVKAGTNYPIYVMFLMVVRWSSVCMTHFSWVLFKSEEISD